ncbi:hypothetical protein [Cryptosporangium phraense]|uniref:PheS-related mystery ligase SrmL n=1 Tax=Cryptosporangium phraense TaxID=2593070 RepID=UPI00197AFD91|nr:hypothetical protein [Cryptosporangium phraense]
MQLLSVDELAAALRLRDLTDPASGPHALQLLLADVLRALTDAWGCRLDVQRRHSLVSVEDNYDRLGYPPDAVARDVRYTRYAAETVVLRSHTTAGVPAALRTLDTDDDVLLALPGLVYRRDTFDRLHTGAPHQVDLWRLSARPLGRADLHRMIDLVVRAVLPGARWRATPASHPYTNDGLQVDVETPDGWVELAECGLAAPHVVGQRSGLALGLGLDRAVMLRKRLDDIRLLRSEDPRVAAQMSDLDPWRPVSRRPPIRRDLSVALDDPPDAELLGDAVRTALGDDADDLEEVAILSTTTYDALPDAARKRLGIEPGQVNVLLRITFRPIGRTLTDAEANRRRAAVHRALRNG